MMEASLKAAGNRNGAQLFRVDGVLDFDSVPGLYRDSLSQLGTQGDVILDLSGVTGANSAGLALLLGWQRLARRTGRVFRMHNLPPSLRNIAAMSELQELLPAEDAAA